MLTTETQNSRILNQKTKLFKTTNRFDIFSRNDKVFANLLLLQNNQQTHKYTNDVFKPPLHIIGRDVLNYLNKKEIIELLGVDNFFCKPFAECLKIQSATQNPTEHLSTI